MAKRSAKYKPKSFESRGVKFTDINGTLRSDTSANLFESMLLSDAYTSLNARLRCLYVIAKAQYYGHRKPKNDFKDISQFQGEEYLYLNWANIRQYGLYKPSDSSTFYKDLKVLEAHGLIKKVSRVPNGKSIFKLSDEWQNFKKP